MVTWQRLLASAKRSLWPALAIAAMISANSAYAQTTVSGKVGTITTRPNDSGASFSIYIVGVSSFCTGDTYSQGFISATDQNYDAMVSTLLSAFMSNRMVSVTSSLSGSLCKISYITVS